MQATRRARLEDSGSPPSLVRDKGPLEDYRFNLRLLRHLLGRVLEPFGLLSSDYLALRLAGEGPCRPSTVSLFLGISPAATTELLDRLEARGLLERGRDREDRRALRLRITPKGKTLLGEARTAHNRFLQGVADELSSASLEALLRTSQELREILERRARAMEDAR